MPTDLDPWAEGPRDEPGQDEIEEAIFLALSPQEFPRTALRFRGDKEAQGEDGR